MFYDFLYVVLHASTNICHLVLIELFVKLDANKAFSFWQRWQ